MFEYPACRRVSRNAAGYADSRGRKIMQHRRFHSVAFAFATLFAAGLGMGVTTANAGAGAPCVAKSFKIKKVEEACKSGGQDAVKTMMKAAVKKAKAAGNDVDCKTCHDDLKTYAVKAGSKASDIEKWL